MSTYKEKFNKKYKFPLEANHSLKEISEVTGYKLNGLKVIFRKGKGAFFTNYSSVRPIVKKMEELIDGLMQEYIQLLWEAKLENMI